MSDQRKTGPRTALTAILIIAIIGVITAVLYLADRGTGETFTEFYILNTRGEAIDYPSELEVGKPEEVILGIVNREREPATYRVEIRIGGVGAGDVGPVFLETDSRLEQRVSFTAREPGNHQKAEFLLYRQGQAGVCQSLYLWVDVRG